MVTSQKKSQVLSLKQVTHMTWAPLDQQLLFTHSTDGIEGIAVVHPNGRNFQKLYRQAARYPVFSPTGRQIAFAGSVSRHGGWGLSVMNADGSATRQLVPGNKIKDVTWSFNGHYIAFTTDGVVGIYHTRTQETTRVGVGRHPSWSGDNKVLSFERDDKILQYDLQREESFLLGKGTHPQGSVNGDLSFYVEKPLVVAGLPVENGLHVQMPRRQYLIKASEVTYHRWTRDGRMLLFNGYWQGQKGLFFANRGEDTARLILPKKQFQFVYSPGISPDGTMVAYTDDQWMIHVVAL